MITKIIQRKLLMNYVLLLLLIYNTAFAEKSTTSSSFEGIDTGNDQSDDIKRIMKPQRHSLIDQNSSSSSSSELINMISMDSSGSSESFKGTSSEEPRKPILTYKDLCEILGNYQLKKESNHYEVKDENNNNKMN